MVQHAPTANVSVIPNGYDPERFRSVPKQKRILVYYDGQVVGEYFADIVVNDVVIVELKAVRRLLDEHEAQLLNYLKATTIEVGLLLNFGPKAEIKRKVYDNDRKGSLAWTQP